MNAIAFSLSSLIFFAGCWLDISETGSHLSAFHFLMHGNLLLIKGILYDDVLFFKKWLITYSSDSVDSLFHCLKKWMPTVKEQWVVLVTNVQPHVQSLKTKSIEAYEASRIAVTPHIVKVQEVVDPYFQVYRWGIFHLPVHLLC